MPWFDGNDTVLVESVAASGDILASSGNVQIGSFMNGKSFFDGSIDEVRIYERALPFEEIIAHFERRRFAADPPQIAVIGPEQTK